MCKVLALSALLANSKAKASAITIVSIVSTADRSDSSITVSSIDIFDVLSLLAVPLAVLASTILAQPLPSGIKSIQRPQISLAGIFKSTQLTLKQSILMNTSTGERRN